MENNPQWAELVVTQAATKTDLEGTEHRLELKIAKVEMGLERFAHRFESKSVSVGWKLESKIENFGHRLELRLIKILADIQLLKWMLAVLLASEVAIFAKLFAD